MALTYHALNDSIKSLSHLYLHLLESCQSKVERYNRKRKEKILIDYPNLVQHYNKHMGGVDLLDSQIERHSNKMRPRRWYMCIFYHLLDITLVNSWLLFRRIHGNSSRLFDFRFEVGKASCKIYKNHFPRQGHPSSEMEKSYSREKKERTCGSYSREGCKNGQL